jgi:hypothetical protein
MSPLSIEARLRLLPTAHGGREGPLASDSRPSWDLHGTWRGRPTLDQARVRFDVRELAAGAEGPAFLEPLDAARWGAVDVGSVVPMVEGHRVVGYAVVTAVTRPAHFTHATAAFANHARQFCDFVEHASASSLVERLTEARVRLSGLYEAGCALPCIEPPEGVEAGASPDEPTGWAGFDAFEVYWEVFDPYVDEAPVAGSLSDDVLDVYRDVRRGLDLWDSTAPLAAAIWEWRFHFDTHWGDHAVDALRALHRACRDA